MAGDYGAIPRRRTQATGEPSSASRDRGARVGARVAARGMWTRGRPAIPWGVPGRGPTGPTPGSDSLSVRPPGGIDREVRRGVPLGGPSSDLPGPSPEPLTPTRVFDRVVGPALGPHPRHHRRVEPGRSFNLIPTGVIPSDPACPPPGSAPGAAGPYPRPPSPAPEPAGAPGRAARFPGPQRGRRQASEAASGLPGPSMRPFGNLAPSASSPLGCGRVSPVTFAAKGIAAPAVATLDPGAAAMECRRPDLGEAYLQACPDCTSAGARRVSHLRMTADPLTDEPRRFLAKCLARDCLKMQNLDVEERVWGKLEAAGRRELATYPVQPGRPRGCGGPGGPPRPRTAQPPPGGVDASWDLWRPLARPGGGLPVDTARAGGRPRPQVVAGRSRIRGEGRGRGRPETSRPGHLRGPGP